MSEYNFDPDNPPWKPGPSFPDALLPNCEEQGFEHEFELIFCDPCNSPLYYECINCGEIWDGPEWENITGSCPICDAAENDARTEPTA